MSVKEPKSGSTLKFDLWVLLDATALWRFFLLLIVVDVSISSTPVRYPGSPWSSVIVGRFFLNCDAMAL